MCSQKYKRASINAMLLAFFSQFSGIGAILIFQTKLFLAMKERGEFDFSITWTVQLTNFITLFSSAFSFYPGRLLGQRCNLIVGQIMVCTCLFGIVVFNEMQETTLLIGALLLFLISFQLSMGPIYFIHVTETCVESVVGFASQILFLVVIM